ncbi:hypothetical protein [Sphingomonas sp. LHG3406-1]|uniref:hypothetical protein n=1 Tax=Sphingomonas sp. LHG3406-1 TaxID=2804617 RepID=UPI002614F8CA|nr:hypothetical protein [Sphingomonas sp. LHG3406-1]
MTYHAVGQPVRLPGQSFEDHQRDMARWMGCSVAEMNTAHDGLHAELCQWMGSTSFSLLMAQGVELSPERRAIAGLEEAAVLHVQRWLQALKNSGEEAWIAF